MIFNISFNPGLKGSTDNNNNSTCSLIALRFALLHVNIFFIHFCLNMHKTLIPIQFKLVNGLH